VHDEQDIVAKVTNSPGQNSVGALAAYLGRSCGHVSLDARVIAQGYRFYPWMSDEIPHFFNKRFTTGSTNLAITLQAGFTLDGEDPFDGCGSNSEARAIVEAEDYDASLWLARVTVGTKMLTVAEVADPLFIAKNPNEFRIITEELVALGVLQGHACPLCSDAKASDDDA
jgi:hypothetical protein